MKEIIKNFGNVLLALLIGFLITACLEDEPKSDEKEDDQNPVLQTAATPSASPAAGEVASGTSITLSCATTGAEIWYTTNNSTPAKNGTGSTKYTTSITINSAITIKAIAFKDGMNNSQMLTAAYTIISSPSWIDPCTQTTQLTGGQELLKHSSGNKALTGSSYGYETWDYNSGNSSPNKFFWYGKDQGGGGAFKVEWGGYFLARLGYYWGNGGPYTQYKNIYVDYNFKRTGTSTGGFIGVYGWSKNPSASKDVEKLIEYYIVDDWLWDGQLGTSNVYQTYTQAKITEKGITLNSNLGNYTTNGSNVTFGQEHGSFTVDGATYKIYTTTRLKEPSIDGDKTFIQVFSVRQGRRTTGTISVTEHFKEWSKFLSLGNMYEAKFKIETFGGTGNFDLTYLYLAQETNPRPADKICLGNGSGGTDSGGTIITGAWKGLSIPSKNTARQHTSYQGKNDVLQVTPGDNWSVLEYSLNSYSGEEVKISVSMDVWLSAASKVAWQVNNDGYPVILGNTTTNLAAGQWHSLSVTNVTITPETNKALYLSKDQLGNNDIYIANFTITVTP